VEPTCQHVAEVEVAPAGNTTDLEELMLARFHNRIDKKWCEDTSWSINHLDVYVGR
jgi:hypothetical protein